MRRCESCLPPVSVPVVPQAVSIPPHHIAHTIIHLYFTCIRERFPLPSHVMLVCPRASLGAQNFEKCEVKGRHRGMERGYECQWQVVTTHCVSIAFLFCNTSLSYPVPTPPVPPPVKVPPRVVRAFHVTLMLTDTKSLPETQYR